MGVVFKFLLPCKCSHEEMFGFTMRIQIIDNIVLRHNIFTRYLIWDKLTGFLYFDICNAFSQAKTYGEEGL